MVGGLWAVGGVKSQNQFGYISLSFGLDNKDEYLQINDDFIYNEWAFRINWKVDKGKQIKVLLNQKFSISDQICRFSFIGPRLILTEFVQLALQHYDGTNASFKIVKSVRKS